MTRGIVIAGGRLDESAHAAVRKDKANCLYFGVDRGIEFFFKEGIKADYYLGDLDSISPSLIESIPAARLMKFPPEKNASDLELALDMCLDMGLEQAEVYGATGSRWDHSFSNLLALERYRQKGLKVILKNGKNQAWALEGTSKIPKKILDQYTYLSILALSPEGIVVSLDNVKYPLTQEELAFGKTRGVSNESIGEDATIILKSGRAICLLSND